MSRAIKAVILAAALAALAVLGARGLLALAASGLEVEAQPLTVNPLRGPLAAELSVCNRSPVSLSVSSLLVEVHLEGAPVARGSLSVAEPQRLEPGACRSFTVPLAVESLEGALRAAVSGATAVVEVSFSVGPLEGRAVARVEVPPLAG